METVEPTKPLEPKSAVREGYNQVADAYFNFATPRPTETRAAYVDRLLQNLAPGDSLLELGCGPGIPCTQQFIAHGLKVTAVDISSAQIELAKQHAPGAEYLVADMMELDFHEKSLDAVVAFYAIFHLPMDQQGQMVEKICGWLKDGGHLLFNLSTSEGDVWRKDWLGPGVNMFSTCLGIDGNRDMMKSSGGELTIIEDEIAIERVGRMEEKFHWFFAVKGKARDQTSD